jgi:hypothetical protein
VPVLVGIDADVVAVSTPYRYVIAATVSLANNPLAKYELVREIPEGEYAKALGVTAVMVIAAAVETLITIANEVVALNESTALILTEYVPVVAPAPTRKTAVFAVEVSIEIFVSPVRFIRVRVLLPVPKVAVIVSVLTTP